METIEALQSVAQETDLYVNYYSHCGWRWESNSPSACNDECFVCEKSDIQPYHSQLLSQTKDAWEAKYKPIQNHLDEDAAYDGNMFETFGAEREYVRALAQHETDCLRVWTLIESENGSSIMSGYQYYLVNRMGYFVTELPVEPSDASVDFLCYAEPPYEEDEVDEE